MTQPTPKQRGNPNWGTYRNTGGRKPSGNGPFTTHTFRFNRFDEALTAQLRALIQARLGPHVEATDRILFLHAIDALAAAEGIPRPPEDGAA